MKDRMNRILAFDPGTENCGYASILYEGKTVGMTRHFGVIRTSKADGDVRQRIDIIGGNMRQLISVIKPEHVVIEDFTEQGKAVGKTYKEMAWLTEHLRMVGRSMGYEVTVYENGEWKKLALGVMRANKEQVKHYVKHTLPEAEELLKRQPTHVWDSVGIGLAKYQTLIRG
jgi:Holliday junction resolvasome RuvABC endonuclease subunit